MSKECETCDSTSMEMCLLIRHCNHWIDKPYNEDVKSKSGKKHIKDSTELSGGHLW